MARAPLGPPNIPGFEAVRLIGAGGYAEVFEYLQLKPRRPVAIKILTEKALASSANVDSLLAEANTMAMVSSHPFIVSIFDVGVSGTGRPYIVMELYPGANYLDRSAHGLPVVEVLRTGVQIAGAIETAHRAGILHRDVKPANILTNRYGKPGLTDFGIASPGRHDRVSAGLSIPWAPPEAFNDLVEPDERADVYSLAATLHHLLTGRSPFELGAAPQSALELMALIERAPVPASGRHDVPASLERVLAHGMAKKADHRPSSAREFARLLQTVENELRLAITELDLEHDVVSPAPRNPGDPEKTRVRITSIDPSPGVAGSANASFPQELANGITSVPANPIGAMRPVSRPRVGMLGDPVTEHTVHRRTPAAGAVGEPADGRPAEKRHPRARVAALVGVGGVVLVAVVAVVAAQLRGDSSDRSTQRIDPQEAPSVNDGGDLDVADFVPPIDDLVGREAGPGLYRFTWTHPAMDGSELMYLVIERPEGGPAASLPLTDQTMVETDARCVEVQAVLDDVGSIVIPGCAGDDP